VGETHLRRHNGSWVCPRQTYSDPLIQAHQDACERGAIMEQSGRNRWTTSRKWSDSENGSIKSQGGNVFDDPFDRSGRQPDFFLDRRKRNRLAPKRLREPHAAGASARIP
jgi:hypothetical protein